MDEKRAKKLSVMLGMKLTQLPDGGSAWQLQKLSDATTIRSFQYFSEVARYIDGTLMEVALIQSFYEELLRRSAAWKSEDVLKVMEWLADKGAPYAPALKDLQSINRALPTRWRSRAAALYTMQLKSGNKARRIIRAETLAILSSRTHPSDGDHGGLSTRDTQLTSVDNQREASQPR